MLTGGCFCGAVRYETRGDTSDASLCHCVNCRLTTGAPAVAWFSVAPQDFRFTRGEPTAFRSTDTGERRFCATCGAQITFQDSRHGVIDVTTATLDDPAVAPPVDNIWVQSRLPWMVGLDALPNLACGHYPAPEARTEG